MSKRGIAWILLLLAGLAANTGLVALALKLHPTKHEVWESYDQENLKRYDFGCPTAVYVAPKGDLVQCQFYYPGFRPQTIVAPPEFDTIEAAVIAAFKAVADKPTALFYEWGGVVVQFSDGKFAALSANTSYSGDRVQIEGSNPFRLNAHVVGSYHTHPCLPEHDVEFFSPQDLQEPIFYHVYAFMGDFCSGNVHEFAPGDQPDRDKAHDEGLYLTKGRIIGQFTEPHALTVAE